MAATQPVTLAGIPNSLLPPTIAGPIFAKATEQSTVMRLARRVPLSMTANTEIPVPLDVPTADWVSEGGKKPLSSGGIGVKTMSGKKVATLVAVSEEPTLGEIARRLDAVHQALREDIHEVGARLDTRVSLERYTIEQATRDDAVRALAERVRAIEDARDADARQADADRRTANDRRRADRRLVFTALVAPVLLLGLQTYLAARGVGG
ncbi:phage major capsid protein [Streptomyces sp. NRRL S-1868]|uniref:phage major capsid protein n=1 Tax=Streptomyces sp. NRRL S-1868 TaxID=1463892 RepID=UPI00099DBAED|nr:phage major capsid protein [Streptomyces sp. NRRL S-1868]